MTIPFLTRGSRTSGRITAPTLLLAYRSLKLDVSSGAREGHDRKMAPCLSETGPELMADVADVAGCGRSGIA